MSDPASLPPGFRFHPTDEELILHYLRNQAASLPCPVSIIAEVDIYKFDPWDLPARAAFGEQEWYFFSPRDRKYPNGVRPNRAAGSGYWKATGTDKPIHASRGGEERIGVKKALVFYKGRPPKGRKTNWIMHEYRLAEARTSNCYKPLKFTDTSMRLDDWVLCRIYKKHCQPQALPPPLVDQEQDEVDPGNYSGGGGYSQSNEQFEGALRLQKSFSVSDFLDGYNTTASAAPPHALRLQKSFSVSDFLDGYNTTASAAPPHGLFDSVPDMNGSELGLLSLNQLLADTSYMSLVQQKLSDQVQDESAALLSAKRPRNNNPAAPESNYLDAATLHALKKPSLSEANIYAADQFSNVQFDSSVHCNIPSQLLLFNQQQILLNSHLGLH